LLFGGASQLGGEVKARGERRRVNLGFDGGLSSGRFPARHEIEEHAHRAPHVGAEPGLAEYESGTRLDPPSGEGNSPPTSKPGYGREFIPTARSASAMAATCSWLRSIGTFEPGSTLSWGAPVEPVAQSTSAG
jgi:hypothetical protein